MDKICIVCSAPIIWPRTKLCGSIKCSRKRVADRHRKNWRLRRNLALLVYEKKHPERPVCLCCGAPTPPYPAPRRRYCKAHFKALDRAKHIRNSLIRYKGSNCHDCGEVFLSCVYDFHHREPASKLFLLNVDGIKKQLKTGFKKALPLILDEAKKCDLLCTNCHRTRHFSDHHFSKLLNEEYSVKEFIDRMPFKKVNPSNASTLLGGADG